MLSAFSAEHFLCVIWYYIAMPSSLYQTIKSNYKKYWLTIAFVLGFFTDVLLLNQIDDVVDNIILLFYVTLATFSILFFYAGVAQKLGTNVSKRLVLYMPIVMQYSFGGLFSGMLIFYARSGDLFSSLPFFILILAVIFGNELVHKRSDGLVYHLALYFVGLFSYTILVLPVLIGIMGGWIFFLSGLLALGVVTLLIQTLYKIVPRFMELNTQRIILSIGFIYILFNTLYFANIIPPIPLSLTQLEIVQSVTRLEDGNYRIVAEEQPWWERFFFIKPELHPTTSSLSCFAKVYAPTRLSTKIFHRWEYKDANNDWQERLYLGYDIAGTNTGGYRGYTTISSFSDGVWRCSVESARGQVLGRATVQIDRTKPAHQVVTRIE